MERQLDAIVPPGHGLVDGVVDHLVDEVVQATRTGRADVHARPFPDRLEALQDRDVLRGVSWFSHKEKALQIPRLRARKVYQTERVGPGSREARRGGAGNQIPELFVGDRERRARPPSPAPPAKRERRRVGLAHARPRRARAAAPVRSAGASARGLRGGCERRVRVARARTPTPTSSCGRAASRRARRAPARRSARSARRPRSATPRRACRSRPAARTATARVGRRQPADPSSTSTSCAGSIGNAERCVAVTSVCPSPGHEVREHSPARRVELGEDVVEQQKRRHGAALGEESGLGEEQRQERQALLALRAEAAQVARAGEQAHVVQVRARTRRSALDVPLEPRLRAPRRREARPS